MDQIIFLGSAGDMHAVGKQLLSSGGIILKLRGYQFHIDPGPGSLADLAQLQINPRETTALFATNTNLPYTNDINAVISAMTVEGQDRKGVLIAAEPVIKGSQEEIPILHNKSKEFVERVITPKPGQKIGIESLEIHILKTSTENIGLKFVTPKHTIIYTGVTDINDEVLEQYEDASIIICNVPLPATEKGGLSADKAIQIINKCNPDKMIITGFGRKILDANPLYVARDMHRQTKVDVIVAKKGLAVNLE